jgi:hypothetical protein
MSGIMCALIGSLKVVSSGGGGGTTPDPVLDTETVTVGSLAIKALSFVGFSSGSYGSCSNGIFAPKSAAIQNLYYASFQDLVFEIAGSQTNAGWTTMKVGSTTFNRSAATFSAASGGTRWTWSGVTSNPFSGAGTNTTVVFE